MTVFNHLKYRLKIAQKEKSRLEHSHIPGSRCTGSAWGSGKDGAITEGVWSNDDDDDEGAIAEAAWDDDEGAVTGGAWDNDELGAITEGAWDDDDEGAATEGTRAGNGKEGIGTEEASVTRIGSSRLSSGICLNSSATVSIAR